MNRRLVGICLILIFAWSGIWSQVSFKNLDLLNENALLFTAETKYPGFGNFSTLFLADPENFTLKQLTVFPESISFVNGSLQVQNRFGVFRSDGDEEGLEVLKEFPAFVNGGEIQTGIIDPVITSPDGSYLSYIRPSSAAYGDLILYRVADGKSFLVSEDIEIRYDRAELAWSPDSKFFVYGKAGSLFYFSIDQYLDGKTVAESYRNLGIGSMANISWTRNNTLYLVQGHLVYSIYSNEFFTRSLYSDLLKIGTIVGKLPFIFDSNFDSFHISPDGLKIMLNKGGQNVFLYYLRAEDFLSTGETRSLPYLYLPRNTLVKKVIWSSRDVITLLTESLSSGERSSAVYRLVLNLNAESLSFTRTRDTGIQDIILSTDERRVAILKEDELEIRNYAFWRDEVNIPMDRPFLASWKNEFELAVAGAESIELIDVRDEQRTLMALSQPGTSGFDGSDIGTVINGVNYLYNQQSGTWASTSRVFSFKEPGSSTATLRVYLENIPKASYANMVMVRGAITPGTESLFPYPEKEYAAFPAKDDPISFTVFNHGSRIRRREVSLVFNTIDTQEGLTDVLRILDTYDITATFFINGEFMRRHPDAVKEIAESRHDVGSLFYVYFNMTDTRYQMDSEFIQEGLARNENDYFTLTGEELSLLWHAPFYFVNSAIISASKKMNYSYIGRDIDTLDWVEQTEGNINAGLYLSSSDIIERIAQQKKPGSIIPIRIGKGEGTRGDYLFHMLEVLINSLIREGYEIVPVTSLMEHAK
jgi:peptidoglycan/xylan/chitin deacetylase (PgdA/CDA1 family)